MPCHEDSPRYDAPGSETIFYYKQEDDLFEIQKRHSTWHYNITTSFDLSALSDSPHNVGNTPTLLYNLTTD